MDDMGFNIFVRKPYQNDSDMLILDGGIIDYDEAQDGAFALWQALGVAKVSLGYISVGVVADDGYVMVQYIIEDDSFIND